MTASSALSFWPTWHNTMVPHTFCTCPSSSFCLASSLPLSWLTQVLPFPTCPVSLSLSCSNLLYLCVPLSALSCSVFAVHMYLIA